MTEIKLGILHPGEMGISIAASAQNAQHSVFWASAGRSRQTIDRAHKIKLIDTKSISSLCEECEIIISVCPPQAADEVASQVLEHKFSGIYVEANAISPQRSENIGKAMASAGISYVDGGIIGAPAWNSGTTCLYISGECAEQVSRLFEGGLLSTHVLGEKIGDASALKMCFAAYSKGLTALLCSTLATAENLGVREALNIHWSRNGSRFGDQATHKVRGVTAKAWRFVAELEEISATFEAAGVPGGAQSTAAEIYRRLAHFKNAKTTPELHEILSALIQTEDSLNH